MSEFEKLRALLDMPPTAARDLIDGDQAQVLGELRAIARRPTELRSAARPAAMAAPPRRRRWTRPLWAVLIVVTVLDAIYLISHALTLP
jgi:hypothetical protein